MMNDLDPLMTADDSPLTATHQNLEESEQTASISSDFRSLQTTTAV